MLWPTVSAVGFLLLTGLVVVLARSRTARWERERRAASRRRRGADAPLATPGRTSTRLRAGLARTAATARGVAVRTRVLRQAVGERVAGAPEEPVRQPAAPGGGEGAGPERTRSGRRGLRLGGSRPLSGPTSGQLPRRLAARLPHRRDRRPDPGELDAGPDETASTP